MPSTTTKPVSLKRKAVDTVSDATMTTESVSLVRKVDDAIDESTKTKSTKNDDVYRLPTAEEMHQLKDTQTLYKSNLFKLQIDELVKESTVTFPKVVETLLHKLKSAIDATQDINECSLAEITALMERDNIQIPFTTPAPSSEIQTKFGYKKPDNVSIVGSFLLKSLVKSKDGYNIDMAVQMPDSLFQEKDYTNHRYFYKRSVYLAVLARTLSKSVQGLSLDMKFDLIAGDEKRPIIVLSGSGGMIYIANSKDKSDNDISKYNVHIRIIPSISSSALPIQKLGPCRNSVRGNEAKPTPRYNSSIIADSTYLSHLTFIHTASAKCAVAFRETSMLAKIWMSQRGFDKETGQFSSSLWDMIVAWLLSQSPDGGKKLLANTYSSFQMFKLSMEFLAKHDFVTSPLYLTKDGKPLDHPEFSKQEFLSHSNVCIIDPSGRLNLASHMSLSQLKSFQLAAQKSVQELNDTKSDHFDSLFLQKFDKAHLIYDHIIRIVDTKAAKPLLCTLLDYTSLVDFISSTLPQNISNALGLRVKNVVAIVTPSQSWAVDASMLASSTREISIGITVDPASSLAPVIHGPSPSSSSPTEISAFAHLWGEKSELRRFKDGSILHSVVFPHTGTYESRSLITLQMASYLVARHAGCQTTTWGGELFPFIQLDSCQASTFKPVMDEFALFTSKLRDISELPLYISSIKATSPALRYTSTFIPQPSSPSEKVYRAPLEVLLEFESSARWPDAYDAMQEMKLAFYLTIANSLPSRWPGCRNLITTLKSDAYIDITTPNSYTFRLRIHCPREKLVSPLLYDLKNLDIVPSYASLIRESCLKSPHLASTIRIFKRWVSAQCIPFPDLFSEVLCLKGVGDAASPIAGFARVLNFLGSWDWEDEVCFLPTGTDEDEAPSSPESLVSEIRENFGNLRRAHAPDGSFGGAYFYIASAIDPHSKLWERRHGNTPSCWQSVRKVSRACLKHLERCCIEGNGNVAFDNVISLDPKFVTRYYESLHYSPLVADVKPSAKSYKNLSGSSTDPLDYLHHVDTVAKYIFELQTSFGHVATFHNDPHGALEIGVNWIVDETPRTFKVNLGISSMPSVDLSSLNKKGKKGVRDAVVINKTSILVEMCQLGDGIASGIKNSS